MTVPGLAPVRVCVCFFGMNRSLSRTLDSIRRNVYRPLERAGLPYAVFAAFMRPAAGSEPDGARLLGAEEAVEIDQDRFDRAFDFGPALSRPDPWQDGGASLRNLCRALHSLDAVTGLWEASPRAAGAEAFLYLRPDLLYHDPLPVASLLGGLAEHGPGLAMTPYWQNYAGRNDRFACLGREAAVRYGRRIARIAAYQADPAWGGRYGLHAEAFVRYALGEVPQPLLAMRASRVRAGGKVLAESFACDGGREGELPAQLRVNHLFHRAKDACRQAWHPWRDRLRAGRS